MSQETYAILQTAGSDAAAEGGLVGTFARQQDVQTGDGRPRGGGHVHETIFVLRGVEAAHVNCDGGIARKIECGAGTYMNWR